MADLKHAVRADAWPELPLRAWQDTYDTLHLWTQIVGKVRMALSPPMNHFWHVTLYVTARGLSTSAIPYGGGAFEIEFDFIGHQLVVQSSDGQTRSFPLRSRSVADFYQLLMETLGEMAIEVRINPMPQEMANPIPFDQDTTHASYDAEYAQRFWRILVSVEQVLQEFRGRFLGKASPVQFFWGSCDLATTRFSGRRAPERPGADPITRESYSHECSSAGWWPGGMTPAGVHIPEPAFYSYIVPTPPGFDTAQVRPAAASFDPRLGEFLLMYDDVRRATSPQATLMEFLQSTYEAGAKLAGWDRASLEIGKSSATGEENAA